MARHSHSSGLRVVLDAVNSDAVKVTKATSTLAVTPLCNDT